MAQKPDDSYVSTMTIAPSEGSVLIITANHVQDLEFFYPYYRFIEEGFRVDVATPEGGEFKGKMGMGLKDTLKLEALRTESYRLLYIPGGKAPAELIKNSRVLDITRQFVESGRPVAAICHGPQVLAASNVIKGKRIAAWPDVEDEVKAAGGIYVNSPAVVDGQFITARWPGDLPAHLKAVLALLRESKHRHTEAA
jgi:protease I